MLQVSYPGFQPAAYTFTAGPDADIIRKQLAQLEQMLADIPVLVRSTEGDADDIGMKLLCRMADLVHRYLAAEVDN